VLLLVVAYVLGLAGGAWATTAYVTNDGSDTVPIDVATNVPGPEIKVGSEPFGIAITPDGKTAYVADDESGTVTPIELATDEPGPELKVGSRPLGVAITPDGKTAYVTNETAGTVTPIELATNKPGPEIKVGTFPIGVAITPDGKTAYITNNANDSVTPIELATNTPGLEIKVGSRPFGVAITPDGKTAYIANTVGGTVTPIEVATNKPGPEIKVGGDPVGVAITPNGKTVYITNESSGTVTPIEVATNKPGPEIKVGSGPSAVAITPDGKTAYITNADSGTVTPIEVATNTPGSEIKVGGQPVGIAITPAAEPKASILSPASGEIYEVGAIVKTLFFCEEGEGGPGLQSCEDEEGVQAPNEGRMGTLLPGEYEYSVTATSEDRLIDTASIKYTVAEPPTAKIESPEQPKTYAQKEVIHAHFKCTEGEFGPGLAFCEDSNGVSAPEEGILETAKLGEHEYKVTATSNDGQTGTASFSYTIVEARCTANTGTITLSPGLTEKPTVQKIKIKGQLTGCAGEAFTAATYIATLKTESPVSCSVLQGGGEPSAGSAKYKWTPKTKSSTGTLALPLTETAEVSISGAVARGPYSPLTLLGTASETYRGAAACSTKKVKKGMFTGSAANFE
jgi:YVTN family beta-propeller protein